MPRYAASLFFTTCRLLICFEYSGLMRATDAPLRATLNRAFDRGLLIAAERRYSLFSRPLPPAC